MDFTSWDAGLHTGDEEHLEHYGVLGMKWGHRKNPEEAFEKAMNRKSHLDRKTASVRLKYAKRQKQNLKSSRSLEKTINKEGTDDRTNKKSGRGL